MRDPDSDSILLGCFTKLAQGFCRLANRRDSVPRGARKQNCHARRRPLTIEPLELRHFLNANGLAALIAPTWFQDVANVGGPSHAGVANLSAQDTNSSSTADAGIAAITGAADVYDWIVQFDTHTLGGITSAAQTTSLVAGGGIDFQAVRGLGLEGQVLLRSYGSSVQSVEHWLSSDSYVTAFEQDEVRQIQAVPNDSLMSQLWGMTKIDAPDAWNISTGATGGNPVVVAVIDTGVDYTHPDLAANIWTNPGVNPLTGTDNDGFVGDLHGYDFADNTGNPMDDNGHGTHVAGTIAAVGDNGLGVAGVDWSAQIMALKFLNSQGTGYLSDAVRAINYATMMRTQEGVNVRVINASWGGGGYSSSMENAIKAANDAGILFVTAAGNDGANNDTSPHYPADYNDPNVISVAASDQNDRLASFSDYGASTVALAAPGVSIYSTLPGGRYGAYSGTSMATPQVAGVAALAWSVAPNATVADIRSAILNGVDHVDALSGKVLSGGRLNAYNTLHLLSGTSQGPLVGSLSASSSSLAAGTNLTLTAAGVADPGGTIAGVYFYRDSNGNGQFDAGDQLLGVAKTIAAGQTSITVGTSGLAPGQYQYFARAIDGNSHWSAAAAVTVSVVAPKTYGSNPATAVSVQVGASVDGTIDVAGQADWFKFQAVAGKHYVFSTTLGSLNDSVLALYDRNGTAVLGYNDDYAGTRASHIEWTAATGGTYFLQVKGYGAASGSYRLNVAGENSAPVLASIADQTMSRTQTTLQVSLSASDADGNPLTYTAQAFAYDPLAKRAYDLNQQLHPSPCGSTYYQNFRGLGEKYLITPNSTWYYILPNGALYRWGGSFAKSTLVDTFTPAYYANPRLLTDAPSPTVVPLSSSAVKLSIQGNVLTITRAAGFASDFSVSVSVGDGQVSASQTFKVSLSGASTAAARAASFESNNTAPTAVGSNAPGAAWQAAMVAGAQPAIAASGAYYALDASRSAYVWLADSVPAYSWKASDLASLAQRPLSSTAPVGSQWEALADVVHEQSGWPAAAEGSMASDVGLGQSWQAQQLALESPTFAAASQVDHDLRDDGSWKADVLDQVFSLPQSPVEGLSQLSSPLLPA